MNTRVFKTHIRKCVAVPEAMASKQDIWSYARTSTAAQDYAAWTDEILGFAEGGISHGKKEIPHG